MDQKIKKIGIFVLILILSFVIINLLGVIDVFPCKSSCNDNPNLKCQLNGANAISIKCEITYFENNFLNSNYWIFYIFGLPIITSLIIFFLGGFFISKIKPPKK